MGRKTNSGIIHTMTDHTDLIARLEAGETGREISDECLRAVGKNNAIGYARPDVSLDAALAHMVPEGWCPVKMSWIWDTGWRRDIIYVMLADDNGQEVIGSAFTPAGALCAAALMARQQRDWLMARRQGD